MASKKVKKSANPAPQKAVTASDVIMSKDMRKIRAYLKRAPRDIVMQYDDTGRNALYDAVFTGDARIVQLLVEYGFDPMTIDLMGGASALHFAAAEGHWDIATYLVGTGSVNVNSTDHEGKTPLEYAMMFLLHDNATDQMTIAHYLIAHGARFRPDMHRRFDEMKELMCMLISDIHRINARQKENLRTRMKMEVKFMIDALNEYNTLFFNDVIAESAEPVAPKTVTKPKTTKKKLSKKRN